MGNASLPLFADVICEWPLGKRHNQIVFSIYGNLSRLSLPSQISHSEGLEIQHILPPMHGGCRFLSKTSFNHTRDVNKTMNFLLEILQPPCIGGRMMDPWVTTGLPLARRFGADVLSGSPLMKEPSSSNMS